MDFKIILSLLLIAHFLGEFYFQSDHMAKAKNKTWSKMLIHGAIYGICVFAATFPFLFPAPWLLLLPMPIVHFGIDTVKRWLLKYESVRKHPTKLFFAEQATHTIAIVWIAFIYAINVKIACSNFGAALREMYIGLQTGLPPRKLVHFACLFLFIWKPASVFTTKILETVRYYKQSSSGKEEKSQRITGDVAGKPVNLQVRSSFIKDRSAVASDENQKAGRYIGILERSLIVVFFLLHQYTAIGFTLTAKSIARFKELENADFAEQYLIGTLVSLLMAIAGAAILGSF